MKRLQFLVVVWILLISCRTLPTPPPVRSLEEVTISEIQNLISADQSTEALQWVLALRNTHSPIEISAEELNTLEQAAKGKLVEQFHRAMESKDFTQALSLYHSFRTVYGEQGLSGYSADRLKLLLAETERNNGNEVTALSFFRRVSDRSGISAEDQLAYARIALDLNNLDIAREIISGLSVEEHHSLPEMVERANRPIPLADYLRGTVTIWVNRGIRMDRGVGIPDRVIGSGFFIDSRGYILTNYHIIRSEVDPEYEGFSRLFIRPSGRSEVRIPAQVVGYDRIFDLALLKVEIRPPFLFGITGVQELTVGSRIYALGSPGGLENTITSGIISAVGRRFFQIGEAMQMDVPVNPGSSGGPLIDANGRLIGIVFAGIEQFQGVNFAIPAYWIQKVLPKLYQQGEVVHPWMGLSVHETRETLEVLFVARGSPASEVGIRRGDRILQIGERSVQTIQEAQSILLSFPVGTLIKVRMNRQGVEQDVFLALDKRPFIPLEDSVVYEKKENLFPTLFGFTARSLSSGLFSQDFIVDKVFQGSVADETGISENDPFTLRNWIVDKDRRIVLMQIIIKQRRAGFLEGGIQLGAFLEQNNFL